MPRSNTLRAPATIRCTARGRSSACCRRSWKPTLGRKLLAGEVHDNSRVVVDYRGDNLTFTSTPLAEAA